MKIVLDETQILEAVKAWLRGALQLQPTGEGGSVEWLYDGEAADSTFELCLEVTRVAPPVERGPGQETGLGR